ncbi:FtsX-like permease family protein [uncultured Acetatifactor sp.]|uniref:ABC transporter permease n=1 Tax=uncultured Acetatifactor sp. TaxID=1671927 RepID=UPI002625137F|nr:FtsX-like permease family protein [uncultured Acetatifactor sp.]
MDIFRKIALQGLKKSRTRTLVTIVGVALSAAMVTAVTSFAASLQAYMVGGAIVKYGGWHVNFPAADAAFLEEQGSDSRVTDMAIYENIGYARLEGGQNPDKPYLFLAGFPEETFEAMPLELILGRLPENDSEVVVPAHVASNGGVKLSLGDTLYLSVGSRTDGTQELNQHDPYLSGEAPGTEQERFVPTEKKVYQVVGICSRPAFEERTAPGYTLITAWKAAGRADSLGAFVTLADPWQARSYGDAAGRAYSLNQGVMRFLGLSDSEAINGYLYALGGILIVLIMLGSVFLIYNSFTISLNDRVRQFGILLSVGATEKQLKRAVLFEGVCIGAIGIPLGVLMGLPVIRLVLLLVRENFGNMMYDTVPLELVVSLPALGAAALISMITILISAYLPARKAAGAPVMECIRQTGGAEPAAGNRKTSESAGRIWGLSGILALKNFRRNRRRYRSIILSLILSVVLCVSAGSLGADLKLLTEAYVADVEGDIFFYPDGMEPEELAQLYGSLGTVEGVYRSEDQAPDMGYGQVGLTFWSSSPAQSAEKMKLVIEAMGVTGSYTLLNVHEKLEENRNMLFIVNLFAVVFIVMISLIATVNVFNTISTNVRLRRRELAMLRSVGMGDREFGRMMRFECLLYGMRTLLYGLPVAMLCSWLIFQGLVGMEDMEGMRFRIPWGSIGISMLGVFLVIFVTMLYAVNRIRRENIIEALRDDMT